MNEAKILGVCGDSLTLLGSLLLATEALWKKTERADIATKKAVVEHFPDAEDWEGNPISVSAEEQAWLRRWSLASKAGAVTLMVGFAFLLASRLSE